MQIHPVHRAIHAITKSLAVIIAAAGIIYCIPAAPSEGAPPFNADNPAASGYTLTFADEFDSPNSIDLANTGQPGFKWYTRQFFHYPTTPANMLSIDNSILTVDGPNGDNGSIETAAPAPNANGYIGTVFGGGGYFEASIAFDPSLIEVTDGYQKYCPAFWAMAVEHMAVKGKDQWPGQDPGYEHFIEIDFVEGNTFIKAGPDTYSGAIHDWYGNWATAHRFSEVMNRQGYIIRVPHGTDFTRFHRYGCLVIPATDQNQWRGSIQYYFDGAANADRVDWTDNRQPANPPPSGDSVFSITDADHLNVLLGCGAGQHMKVDYVHIWQVPSR